MGYVLRSLGESPVEAEIQDIIRTIDKDGNGQIDFQEFCIFMHNKRASVDPEQEIETLFQLFDKDNTGMITTKGIQHVMKMLGEEITEEEALYMIKVAAKNQSTIGINRIDFKDLMAN